MMKMVNGEENNDHANGENYDDDDVDDCIQGGESPCQFTGYAFLWMAGKTHNLYMFTPLYSS